jgi:hypothetical protein
MKTKAMSIDNHYCFMMRMAERIYPEKERALIVHLLIGRFSSLKHLPESVIDKVRNEHGINLEKVLDDSYSVKWRFQSLINASMVDIELVFGKELAPLINQIRHGVYD